MWSATLAVLCVCITIGPPTVRGWDVKGRLDLYYLDLDRLFANCTMVTKIATDFLQGVQFSIGGSVYENKVVPQDWKRRGDGLYSVHVTHVLKISPNGSDLVSHYPMISPGYNPIFCWEPIDARVSVLTATVKIGEPRMLTCRSLANGTAPRTYKWYKSPGPPDYIHIGQQLLLPASNIHEGGAYSCEVQNECGKTKRSPVTNVFIEVPFLVEDKTSTTAVTTDDLSFNITISGNHLHSPTLYMLDDTIEPTIQSRDIEGNFHYGQRKAKLFTMRWNVSGTDRNATCYDTSMRVNGDYILRVMFQETEKQVTFQVDMQCASTKTRWTDQNKPTVGPQSPVGPMRTLGTDENKPTVGTPYHSELGTGIGIGVGIILVLVLVAIAIYFIKKKMTKEQADDINLLQG